MTNTDPGPAATALADRRGRLGPLLERRFVRWCLTSAVGVVLGQGLLFLFASVLEWPGVVANVSAVVLSTIPTYLLSRRWVWSRSGRSKVAAEVLPYWVMTFLGLALSSFIVWLFERWWPNQPLLVNLGNVLGFGILWVAKFLLLDRVLFATREG